jgi:hypothetical protein
MSKVDDLYEQLQQRIRASQGADSELEAAKAKAGDLEKKLKADRKAVRELQPKLHEALEAEIKSRRANLTEASKALKRNDYEKVYDLLTNGGPKDGDIKDLCLIIDDSGSVGDEAFGFFKYGAIYSIQEGPDDGKYCIMRFSNETKSTGWVAKSDKPWQSLPETGDGSGSILYPGAAKDALEGPRKSSKHGIIMATDGELSNAEEADSFLRKCVEAGHKLCVVYLDNCNWVESGTDSRSVIEPMFAALAEVADVYVVKTGKEAREMMKVYSAHLLKGAEKPEGAYEAKKIDKADVVRGK